MPRRLLSIATTVGCLLLVDCTKVAAPPPLTPSVPIVQSNKNEPVIFDGQRFTVSFDYLSEQGVYDVSVRRTARPLSEREGDLKAAERVAQSTLTHYACPGASKARRVDDRAMLDKKGEWRSQFRCA